MATRPDRTDPPRQPRHIAIIMDGNGRFAERQGLPRVKGHEAGVRTIREITEECARIGIERLTLYSFSIENWRRPRTEVLFLMRLLKRYLVDERPTMAKNRVRLTAIGRLLDLPGPVRRELDKSIALTAKNDGLNLCLALSYGGRAELVDAMRSIAAEVAAGKLAPGSIDERTIASRLYQPGIDPDLVIRTAGEVRVSNFLLWQISYSEFVISDACWPEFRAEHLHEAMAEYARRVRKFGGLVKRGAPAPAGIE